MRSLIESKWAVLTIAVGGLFALVFYAYSAGFLSVSCDEFAKTVTARRGLAQPSEWFAGVWQPLHLALIALTSVITGDLLFASRLVSIIFGAVLVAAVAGIGRQTGGNWGGALAAVLAATHPLVVLLSATAMVDICYVATFMMGLRFYLLFSSSPRPGRVDLFAACGLMTLSCALHYNAWIAVLLLAPFLLRDLYRSGLPHFVVAASLIVLGSMPLAWVGWNWVHTGQPLAFFTKHSEYSANVWAYLGWLPSPRAALVAVGDSLRVFSPLLAILALSGIGLLRGMRSVDRRSLVIWSLLIGFLAALVFLYARGGRPAAFEPRYALLPSMLMIAIVAGSLVKLWVAGDRQVRAFIVSLSICTVVVNMLLCRDSIDSTTKLGHHGYVAEARDIATVMHHLKSREAPRMVLEIKYWNFLAMPVFLNRLDAIVMDRELKDDSVRHFENPSLLLGAREPVLAQLRAKNVGYIAAWTPEVLSHIEPWGLRRVAKVDSYTIYRIPKP